MLRKLGVMAVILISINIMLVLGGYQTIDIYSNVNSTAEDLSQATTGSTAKMLFKLKDLFLIFLGFFANIMTAPFAFVADVGAPWEIRLVIGVPLVTLNIFLMFTPLYYAFSAIVRRYFG